MKQLHKTATHEYSQVEHMYEVRIEIGAVLARLRTDNRFSHRTIWNTMDTLLTTTKIWTISTALFSVWASWFGSLLTSNFSIAAMMFLHMTTEYVVHAYYRQLCVRACVSYNIENVKEQHQGEADGQSIDRGGKHPSLILDVGMSTPAQKALSLTRTQAYRLRLYSTQLPLYNPTESSRKVLTTKPSMVKTPSAETHSASSLFSSAMAGLPSLSKVSVDNGTNS